MAPSPRTAWRGKGTTRSAPRGASPAHAAPFLPSCGPRVSQRPLSRLQAGQLPRYPSSAPAVVLAGRAAAGQQQLAAAQEGREVLTHTGLARAAATLVRGRVGWGGRHNGRGLGGRGCREPTWCGAPLTRSWRRYPQAAVAAAGGWERSSLRKGSRADCLGRGLSGCSYWGRPVSRRGAGRWAVATAPSGSGRVRCPTLPGESRPCCSEAALKKCYGSGSLGETFDRKGCQCLSRGGTRGSALSPRLFDILTNGLEDGIHARR